MAGRSRLHVAINPNNARLFPHAARSVVRGVQKAVGEVGFEIRAATQFALPQVLDRPTPAVVNSVVVQREVSDTAPSATVTFASRDAGFTERLNKIMLRHEEGGTNTPDGGRQAVAVPVNAPLNKYGSMRRGWLKRILGKAGVFTATIGGVSGAFQQGDDGWLVLLAVFKDSTRYDRRPLGFVQRAADIARYRLPALVLQRVGERIARGPGSGSAGE